MQSLWKKLLTSRAMKSTSATRRRRQKTRLCLESLEERLVLSTVFGDFNGDTFADLAIGVPGEAIGTRDDAGAVNIIYGTADGLGADANQIWHQNQGLVGASESGDEFGAALAAGDFNGDNYMDLAVGIPGEDVVLGITEIVDAGAVAILYGGPNGLSSSDDQLFHQESADIDDWRSA